MNKPTQMTAVLAALAAAGAGGYAVKQPPTLTDEQLVAEMLNRVEAEQFRAMVTEMQEKRKAERQPPPGIRYQRALQAGGEEECLATPAGFCMHCEEPSVKLAPRGPFYLRRCLVCERRWTIWEGGSDEQGIWWEKALVPGYRQAMREDAP